MVNSTEALKLALEALEASTDWDVNATGKQLKSMQAITALRKALAQPEQKPVAKYSDIVSDSGLDPRNKFNIPPQRTEQEPVAWTWDTQSQHDGFLDAHFMFSKPESTFRIMNLQALYSHPPRRTWAGLTEEEIDSYFEDHGWSPSEYYYSVIKDIEAKLKERNT